jgi:predicted transcriptional regulator with HTH domain
MEPPKKILKNKGYQKISNDLKRLYPIYPYLSNLSDLLRSKPVFLPPTIFAVVPKNNLRRLRIMFGRSMCFIECTNSIKQYQMEAYEAS